MDTKKVQFIVPSEPKNTDAEAKLSALAKENPTKFSSEIMSFRAELLGKSNQDLIEKLSEIRRKKGLTELKPVHLREYSKLIMTALRADVFPLLMDRQKTSREIAQLFGWGSSMPARLRMVMHAFDIIKEMKRVTEQEWQNRKTEMLKFLKENPNSNMFKLPSVHAMTIQRFYNGKVNIAKLHSGVPISSINQSPIELRKEAMTKVSSFVKENGPCTYDQISEKTGMNRQFVGSCVQDLNTQHKLYAFKIRLTATGSSVPIWELFNDNLPEGPHKNKFIVMERENSIHNLKLAEIVIDSLKTTYSKAQRSIILKRLKYSGIPDIACSMIINEVSLRTRQ